MIPVKFRHSLFAFTAYFSAVILLSAVHARGGGGHGGHGGHSGSSSHGSPSQGGGNRGGHSSGNHSSGHNQGDGARGNYGRGGRNVATHGQHDTGRQPHNFERANTRYTQHRVAEGNRSSLRRSHNRFEGNTLRTHHRYYDRVQYFGRPYFAYHRHWGYPPAFWYWYAAPYPAPVNYAWHWRWAPYWGYYYAAYPVYYSADYWVTDYVVSRTMSDVYVDDDSANVAKVDTPGTAVGTNEKEQLRAQVNDTAALHSEEKPLELANALENPKYLFLVDNVLGVLPEGSDKPCLISGGNLLKTARKPADNETYALMQVVTSRNGDCPAGTKVQVPLGELQEMLNSFSAKTDDGLHELQQSESAPKE
jgi:hypothetical protein